MATTVKDNVLDDLKVRLRRLMTEHRPWLSPTLSMNVVAKMLGTTKDYISALMVREGMDFKDMLNEYRLEYAKKLMQKEPEAKMDEIAFKSGFGCVFSFGKSFKKHYAITPAKYKKQPQRHA